MVICCFSNSFPNSFRYERGLEPRGRDSCENCSTYFDNYSVNCSESCSVSYSENYSENCSENCSESCSGNCSAPCLSLNSDFGSS